MAAQSNEEQLAEKQYVTLLLRLLVDQRGRLVQGEIVTLDAQSRGHFSRWRDLVRLVREALPR